MEFRNRKGFLVCLIGVVGFFRCSSQFGKVLVLTPWVNNAFFFCLSGRTLLEVWTFLASVKCNCIGIEFVNQHGLAVRD